MTTITDLIRNALRALRGESAASTVTRKEQRINRVVSTETRSIQTIIDGEIAGARTLAAAALNRIEAIAATGLMTAEQRSQATALRNFLGKTVAA